MQKWVLCEGAYWRCELYNQIVLAEIFYIVFSLIFYIVFSLITRIGIVRICKTQRHMFRSWTACDMQNPYSILVSNVNIPCVSTGHRIEGNQVNKHSLFVEQNKIKFICDCLVLGKDLSLNGSQDPKVNISFLKTHLRSD